MNDPPRRKSARVAAAAAAAARPPPKRASPPPKRPKPSAAAAVVAPSSWRAAPVVHVGASRSAATLFLGGDGRSLAQEPRAAVGDPCKDHDSVFEDVTRGRLAKLCHGFEEYWAGSGAAQDGAACTGLRAFRHVGRVAVRGAYVEKATEGKGGIDGVVNLWEVIRKDRLKSCYDGKEGKELVQALKVLAEVESSPFPAQLGVLLVEERRLGEILGKGRAAVLEVEVYLGRMLFEIIAFPELITLFQALQVDVEALPQFRRGSDAEAAKFGRSPVREEEMDDFTFEALLRRAESTGYREMGADVDKKIHDGLTCSLLPFQRDTVQFMIDRATDVRGLNDYFWQKFRYTPGGGGTVHAADSERATDASVAAASSRGETEESLFFFPMAGEVRLRSPPTIRGAAIVSEMGLGKTISALATVLALQQEHTPFQIPITYADIDRSLTSTGSVKGRKLRSDFTDSAGSHEQGATLLRLGDVVSGIDFDSDVDPAQDAPLTVTRWPAKSTLVVLPPSLLAQWRDEVESKAPSLKVHVWKSFGTEKSDQSVAVGEDACDIVLATYDHLQRDKLISLIHWNLLILDEAQLIRRSMSVLAKECLNMQCNSRFLMTGTPLVQGIRDLAGELAFLRLWPFTLLNDGFFERHIEEPWDNRSSHDLLDKLVASTMMRHSKAQSNIGLSLPARSYRILKVQMPAGSSSRATYQFIRACAEDELERASEDHQRPCLRALRSLFNLLRATCVSSGQVSTFALDFARRVVWAARRAAVSTLEDPLDSFGEIGESIRTVSPEAAMTFVAAVTSGGTFARQSNRTFAVNSGAAANALSPYQSMAIDELRGEVLAKDILSESAAASTTRPRLMGLLAGGVEKLKTDSIDDMRREVIASHLMTEVEAQNAPRARLLASLSGHLQFASGLKSGSVHQAGYDVLHAMSESGEIPSCPVCLDDACTRPCVVACGHFYCRVCVVSLIASSPSAQPRCAICRRKFMEHEVVEITLKRHLKKGAEDPAAVVGNTDDEDDDDEVAEDSDDAVMSAEVSALLAEGSRALSPRTLTPRGRLRARSSLPPTDSPDESGSASMDNSTSTLNSPESDSTDVVSSAAPSAAAFWEEYESMDIAGPEFNGLGFVPTTPSLPVRFLRHLAAAQREPAKFDALLDFINEQEPNVKFVVVAEAANTLQACGLWLAEKGVQSVGVGMGGGSARSRLDSTATREFRTDSTKRIFLLNTASAAGLTLTEASFVVFLEPLVRRADELQAASRVHRIGQTSEVEIVRMITANSIEEDLVAARGGNSSSSDGEEAAALTAAPLTQLTDDLLLDVFGWERGPMGFIRRKVASRS